MAFEWIRGEQRDENENCDMRPNIEEAVERFSMRFLGLLECVAGDGFGFHRASGRPSSWLLCLTGSEMNQFNGRRRGIRREPDRTFCSELWICRFPFWRLAIPRDSEGLGATRANLEQLGATLCDPLRTSRCLEANEFEKFDFGFQNSPREL